MAVNEQDFSLIPESVKEAGDAWRNQDAQVLST
jgi:hypothetical protein